MPLRFLRTMVLATVHTWNTPPSSLIHSHSLQSFKTGISVYIGRIWQTAHLTECAARLIKCVHLTNLRTCAGKVYGWIRVRDRVTIWVGVRIRVRVSVRVRVMVRALIK